MCVVMLHTIAISSMQTWYIAEHYSNWLSLRYYWNMGDIHKILSGQDSVPEAGLRTDAIKGID